MMAFNNNFVVAVKQGGRILRETNGEVHLPFGTEYSILLKNLNSRKALVKISIDGRDIGGELIIDANSDSEIERFIDGNLNGGYRFKFIEKTQKVRTHRGDKIDDGVIRVEYTFEKEQPIIIDHHHHYHNHHHHDYYHDHYHPRPWPWGPIWSSITSNVSDNVKYSSTVDSVVESDDGITYCYNVNSSADSMAKGITRSKTKKQMMSNVTPFNEDGITVEGSDSNQHFHYGSIDECESQSHVITLHLRGTTINNIPIQKPITVKTKFTCKTCGTSSKSSVKFCRECGTRLI